MKKWILIAGVLIIAGISFSIFFTAAVKNETPQVLVTCNSDAAMRIIVNESNWQNWWPGEKKADSLYNYKNYTYRIDKILLNGFDVTVFNNKDSVKGNLQVISAGMDSSFFVWNYTSVMPVNPFKKLINYFSKNDIGNNIENAAQEIKKHFDKEENVYGMKVIMQKVADSALISLKNTFDHYPSNEEVYSMIKLVKEYIIEKGGEETNYPMLNVHQEGPANFETMVAIPTKKPLPSQNKFQVKRMVLGNILMGEIKGGITTIINGEKQLANYVTDHKKLSPAISYQSLVTNRLLEKDSAKWVTRLYYPIFY